MIFSDGVTEAETVTEEEFGLPRVRAIIADHAAATPAEIADAIVTQVQRFSKPESPCDDLTVLIAKRI